MAKVVRDAVVVFGGATGMVGSNICIEGRKRGFKMIALARCVYAHMTFLFPSFLLCSRNTSPLLCFYVLPVACVPTICARTFACLVYALDRSAVRTIRYDLVEITWKNKRMRSFFLFSLPFDELSDVTSDVLLVELDLRTRICASMRCMVRLTIRLSAKIKLCFY